MNINMKIHQISIQIKYSQKVKIKFNPHIDVNLTENNLEYIWTDYESIETPTLVIDDYFYSDYFKFSSMNLNIPNMRNSLSPIETKDKFYSILKNTKNNYTIEDFDKLELIGRGYYGKVYLVLCKKDNKKYALKSLKKSKLIREKEIEHMNYEQKILEIVNHPFIVELKSLFQTEEKIYIMTEYYSGGELFYQLRNLKSFSHELTKFYFAQIYLAIEFLHNKNIIFRDLKPENIILDENGFLKLTDFGLAKDNIDENKENSTSTFCGTNEYLAPEVILGESYGKSVDVWCLGILLYEMYFGIAPFYDMNKETLYKKIMFSDADFKMNNLNIPNEAKDLISRLLDKNQKTRIKVYNIRQHIYFNNFDFDALIRKKMIPPLIITNNSNECLTITSSNPSTADNDNCFDEKFSSL